MFRRIELISPRVTLEKKDGILEVWPALKGGLCGMTTCEEVIDAWIHKLRSPKVGLPENTRFYFTETGWDEIGREVIAACQRNGQEYRVIARKENDLDVVYRDEYQVAGQPVRRGRKEGVRRRPPRF